MAPHKQGRREPFEVEFDGQKYACERTIIGTTRRVQEIRVHGVGRKNDAVVYGRRGRPVRTMKGIAEIIAWEILSGRE
ncbi:MAG TPA: hypothetical protein VFQ52_01480 [Rhizomicrobium sp.]|nr:hypothetical protein [Rhizomicrobium sp.]